MIKKLQEVKKKTTGKLRKEKKSKEKLWKQQIQEIKSDKEKTLRTPKRDFKKYRNWKLRRQKLIKKTIYK